MGGTKSALVVIIYVLILLSIPFILDYVYNNMIKSQNMKKIKEMVASSRKPLMIFQGQDNITYMIQNIKTDILKFSESIRDNSVILILDSVLEYVDDPNAVLKEARRISGGDLYIIGHDQKSVRSLFDYRIKRLLSKPYFLPNQDVSLSNLNNLQIKIQKIYQKIAKVIPYDHFIM